MCQASEDAGEVVDSCCPLPADRQVVDRVGAPHVTEAMKAGCAKAVVLYMIHLCRYKVKKITVDE